MEMKKRSIAGAKSATNLPATPAAHLKSIMVGSAPLCILYPDSVRSMKVWTPVAHG